jgi:hypothetical protein
MNITGEKDNMTISNEQGRALEYTIVKEIEKYFINIGINTQYTSRAIRDNSRDHVHFNNLSNFLKEDFRRCAMATIVWMQSNDWFNNASTVLIDRLPDSSGVSGNVTDINFRIIFENGSYDEKNLSLKHNHNALKHPRLTRLPDQCGIYNPKLKLDYLNERDKIWGQFFYKARKLDPNFTKFSEVKSINKYLIEEYLYEPLINLVISFLNAHVNNSVNASSFFKFLTCHNNFYVVKNDGSNIVVKHFIDIPQPSAFNIYYPYNGRKTTFLMNFDNGWEITLRLHTASKEFFKNNKINTSTKFDVNCRNLDSVIKTEVFKKLTL